MLLAMVDLLLARQQVLKAGCARLCSGCERVHTQGGRAHGTAPGAGHAAHCSRGLRSGGAGRAGLGVGGRMAACAWSNCLLDSSPVLVA